MSWPTVALGDIAEFRNGLNYSRENFGLGLKVISVGNFGDRLFPDFGSLSEINPDGVAKSDDYLADGDLLFVRSNGNRDLVGRAMLMRGIGDQSISFSGFCIRGRFRDPEECNPAFFTYQLRDPAARQRLTAGGVGASIANVSQKTLSKLEVVNPRRDVQDAVVSVIFGYDNLIATNQRRIALLEEAARHVYREWFVHLRFPGYEAVKMVDGVPDGWVKAPISEQSAFLNRGIAPKYDDSAKGQVINQKCIRGGRLDLEPARHQSKEVKAERLLQVGDVLINSTGTGTLGRVAQVRSAIEDCTVDTHVTIARPLSADSAVYFGQALLSLEPSFSEMGKGATNQLELGRADIGAVPIWQPPMTLQSELGRMTGPMLQQAEYLAASNRVLAQARDALLPKLMSGQLDVSNISIRDVSEGA